MRTNLPILLALAGACTFAGCSLEPPGASRVLGDVPMGKAFEVSHTVISQYFRVETQDAQGGVILCRPEYSEGYRDRFLGKTPARELARLQLRRCGQTVTAYVQVTLETQMITSGQQGMPDAHPYSGVPNDTPADTTGATTPEQNIAWHIAKYDHEKENAILDDIYAALHYKGTTRPASRPVATAPAAR